MLKSSKKKDGSRKREYRRRAGQRDVCLSSIPSRPKMKEETEKKKPTCMPGKGGELISHHYNREGKKEGSSLGTL